MASAERLVRAPSAENPASHIFDATHEAKMPWARELVAHIPIGA